MSKRLWTERAITPPLYLREWRESRGLSLEALAERLDTSAATISRIETGKRDWTGRFLTSAALMLNCAMIDLLTRTPGEQDVIGEIRKMPPEERDRLMAAIRAFRGAQPK